MQSLYISENSPLGYVVRFCVQYFAADTEVGVNCV